MLELEDGEWIKLHDSCRSGIFQYEVTTREAPERNKQFA